jgi:phospho-N-acetylmuramoyl-pentapeptide-transferase
MLGNITSPGLLLTPFWVAFIASSLVALPSLRLLMRLKSRQTVSEYVPEHAQKQGTPTMGGIIIVVGSAIGLIASLALPVRLASIVDFLPIQALLPYLLLIAGFAAIGFVDDFVVPRLIEGKRGLGWKQKFGLEILFGALAMWFVPGTTLASGAAAVFLILFFSNAYNFVDGMDAMAGGVGIFLLLGLAMLDRGQTMISMTALAIVGAFIPFLVLNAPPAKVFMGDVGSLPIGACAGLMVYQLGSKSSGNDLPLLLISGVMAVQLIPVPIQIASVKLFKRRVFTMTPVHHGFQKNGIAETRIVWAFILGQFMLSAAAISAQWYMGNGQ